MANPILHTFRFCPYATRARMVLHAAGIAYDHREINLAQKPPAFLEISAKGTVPVLLLSDGKVIDESLDIMTWAVEQNDPFGWKNMPEEEKAAALEIVKYNDKEFALNSYRLRNPHKVDFSALSDKDQKKSIEELYEEPCKDMCNKLNSIFEAQPFLSGEDAGFTDIAIFPFMWFLSQDVTWINTETYPNLHRWLKAIENKPYFAASMQRVSFWQGDKKAV